MRLYILSDLHLEFAAFAPPPVDADLVILAGDTHTGANGLRWALTAFPDRPVIYVLGNHEFYGRTLPKLTHELKEAAQGTHVQVMENDRFVLGDLTILAATLWTDFNLNGDRVLAEITAQTGMTDYHRICTWPRYSRLRPDDTRRLHAESARWMQNQLAGRKDGKLVIVTHHAPSRKSIPPRYENDPLNPAFASNLEGLVAESRAQLWIHGHIHYCVDYRLGETRVLANPRGYPGEMDHGFDPGLVLEV